MRRLLLIAAPLALMFGAGCTVRSYGYREHVVDSYSYRFYGAHPVPNELGGGWCFIDGDHVHEYAPQAEYYSYSGSTYTYAGPTVIWYHDYHPEPSGSHCRRHGRHSHDYTPGRQHAPNYYWDNTSSVYVYNDNYHDATGSGRAPNGYVPPPSYSTRPPPGSASPPSGSGYSSPPPPPGGMAVTPNQGYAPPPGNMTIQPPPTGSPQFAPPPGHNGIGSTVPANGYDGRGRGFEAPRGQGIAVPPPAYDGRGRGQVTTPGGQGITVQQPPPSYDGRGRGFEQPGNQGINVQQPPPAYDGRGRGSLPPPGGSVSRNEPGGMRVEQPPPQMGGPRHPPREVPYQVELPPVQRQELPQRQGGQVEGKQFPPPVSGVNPQPVGPPPVQQPPQMQPGGMQLPPPPSGRGLKQGF